VKRTSGKLDHLTFIFLRHKERIFGLPRQGRTNIVQPRSLLIRVWPGNSRSLRSIEFQAHSRYTGRPSDCRTVANWLISAKRYSHAPGPATAAKFTSPSPLRGQLFSPLSLAPGGIPISLALGEDRRRPRPRGFWHRCDAQLPVNYTGNLSERSALPASAPTTCAGAY
jgi:hypothetical protein